MSEYVVAQASVLIVPTLGKGANEFHVQLEKLIKSVPHEVQVQAKLDAAKMRAQWQAEKAWLEAQNIDINARINPKQLTEIRHKYEDLSREFKKGLFLDLKVAGLNLLPQLSYGLAAANASMVQLAQSATLLPGILSGVLSSVASLATGLSGVKGAFKEYSDAQKNAAQTGLQARNAALNVQNAYRDLGRAFKDAQRNLEDLNAQLRDAPLDEADAIIRVQEAIAEANDRAGKSGLQQQKDALAVIKAENALADTRMRNSRLVQDVAEANAKGVAGADSVREATDRLAKAQDDASTKATKLTDSLAKLSPNAQAFVKAVTGMQSAWLGMRDSVQDRLFAGLDAEITKLGQSSIPALQKGLGGIADSLNGNVKAAFKSLENQGNLGFLDRIMGNTANAQGKLSSAFDPLIDAFLRLSAVGSDLLPRLSDGLTDLLTRFDNFIIRAEGDGSLEKWMGQGMDALKELGNSILNVGSILNSLSEAFTGTGGRGLLTNLEEGTKSLADFLKSAEGQQKLADFFKEARSELAQWKPVLDTIPDLLKNVSAAGKAWADALLPKIQAMANLLANHPRLVSAIFSAYMLWRNVSPVVKGVSTAIEALGKGMDFLHNNVMAGAQGPIGKYAASVGWAKEKVSNLTSAIMSGGGLATAAALAVTWMGTNLVRAHDDAAAAARRQDQDLSALKNTLDEVTGAATKATTALITKNLFSGENAATGVSNPDAFKTAVPDEAKRHEIAQNIASGKLDAALAGVPGATAADIEATDSWKNQGSYYAVTYQDFGLTPQDLADAVNGKPDAKARYDEWVTKNNHAALPFLPDSAGNVVANALNSNPTSLLDIQNQLPANVQAGAVTRQEIYAGVNNLTADQQRARDENLATYGRATLSPSSQLAKYGLIGDPGFSADGGSMLTSSAPAPGSAEADELRKQGITFTENTIGQFNVSLSPEAAKANLVKAYASGGLIAGPGSGTSDSILARLSHGEFVVNAASTQQHLPLLEKINGGKLPGFDGGGEVTYVYPVGAGDVSTKGSINTGLPTMDAANRPGEFNHNNFQSFGQAQAARRGIDTSKRAADFTATQKPSALGKAVGNVGDFLNASMGLYNITGSKPPDGYKEVSTATVSTRRDKPVVNDPWVAVGGTFGGTPLPPKTPKPPVPPTAPPKPAPASPTPAAPPLAAEVGATSAPHVGGGAAPGPGVGSGGVPSVTVPLPTVGLGPNGQIVLDLSGSGALPETKSSGASAVAGAPIIPNANIVGYLTQLGEQSGLGVGSTYDVNHGGTHQADGGQHSVNRAADLGSAAKAQDGSISRWVQAWMSDPVKVAATRQLIFRGPDGDYGIINGRVLSGQELQNVFGGDLPDHTDHVHIALEGVPADATSGFVAGVPNGLSVIGANGQVITSPSNMSPAMTPTGVQLPQLTYGNGDGTASNDPQKFADNWVKYVSESWQKTFDNLAQNAGQIALKFLGSFVGLDLSGLASIGQSAFGDLSSGIDKVTGNDKNGKGGGKDANLPANGDLASIIQSAEFQKLPPSVQQAYLQAYQAQKQQGSVQYNPNGGAEQWRPVVRQALGQVASKYGINNLQAWEDDIVGQINLESGGNPNRDNLNDSNGQGGTQQVYGLGQFHPDTFKAHNVTGGDIHDPVAQIFAMIDYLASPTYGVLPNGGVNWKGKGWRNGKGYASGGSISGSGTGRSDSILARVSNGEYIVKASAAQKNLGLLNAINSGLPGFVDGMLWPIGQPAPVTPPPVTAPPAPLAPNAPDPNGPAADAQAGIPAAPTPVTDTNAPGDPASTALSDMGAALGGIGDSLQGAQAPAGGDPTSDPRSVMGAAPQNLEHNNPAVSKGIEGAAGAIAGAVSTAMAAASVAANAQAPGSGQGISSASGMVTGLIAAGGSAVSGAVNILSSLGVGTLTKGTTAGAYGTPLMPEANGQQPYSGPAVVNNWNGGVHTSNNEEFYKQQQRRELQNASPYLPQR